MRITTICLAIVIIAVVIIIIIIAIVIIIIIIAIVIINKEIAIVIIAIVIVIAIWLRHSDPCPSPRRYKWVQSNGITKITTQFCLLGGTTCLMLLV